MTTATATATAVWQPSLFIGISGPYDLVDLGAHLHARGLDDSIVKALCAGGSATRWSPTALLRERERLREISTGRSTRESTGEGVGHERISFQDKPLPFEVVLFHGTLDATVPVTSSVDLIKVLHGMGGGSSPVCEHRAVLYEGWSHTDAILEGPMEGNQMLVQDIHQAITTHFQAVTTHNNQHACDDDSGGCSRSLKKKDYTAYVVRKEPAQKGNSYAPGAGTQLVSPFLLSVARKLNPF